MMKMAVLLALDKHNEIKKQHAATQVQEQHAAIYHQQQQQLPINLKSHPLPSTYTTNNISHTTSMSALMGGGVFTVEKIHCIFHFDLNCSRIIISKCIDLW